MGENIIKNKLLALLKAAAPWKWPLAFAGVFLGLALSRSQGSFSYEPWRAAGCLIISVGLLAAANLTEDLKAEKGLTSSGRLKKKETQTAIILAVIIAIAAAVLTVPFEYVGLWIMGALAILAALIRPQNNAWYKAKETLAGVFFGPIAVMGTEKIVSGQYSVTGILAGMAMGVFTAGLAAARNLRDLEADKAAKHMSWPAEKGRGTGLNIFKYLLLAGIVLSGMTAALSPWVWGATVVAFIFCGRMNASLGRIGKPAEYDDLSGRLVWWIFIWAGTAALGLIINP